jgi:hypothetical protein
MAETLTEKQRVLFSMLNKTRYPGRQIIPPEDSKDRPSRGITR